MEWKKKKKQTPPEEIFSAAESSLEDTPSPRQQDDAHRRGLLVLVARAARRLKQELCSLRWRLIWREVVITLSVILLLTALVVGTWKWWLPELIVKPVVQENVQIEQEPLQDEVQVTPDLPPTHQVQNIALFGLDQKEGSVGRSDALIILSIDKAGNKIKLTSLDRDSLVSIDGHGEEKLTHAWAYGQGTLAVKTLNQNFGMNITDYAYVNFTEFVSAIDYLGGVMIDVDAAEQTYLNEAFNPKYKYFGAYVPRIEVTGRQRLNGTQALGYSRNRSDGTTQRAARQREVLDAMLSEVKKQSVTQWPDTLGRMLQLCHTTLTVEEMTDLAMWVLEESPVIEELSLPTAELNPWSGVLDSQRGWVRVYDLEAATVVLHNFIYETEQPLPENEQATTEDSSGDAPEGTKDKTTATE